MVARLIGWWRGLGRTRQLALLAGVAVTGLRLALLGKGTMAFIDERRYVTAMLGLRGLGEGHGLAFLQAINSLGARPGDGLWRALPGLGQAALLLGFGLNPNSPPSLLVPQLFNLLVVTMNAGLLYRIYRRFFGVGLALLGVGLYSSLVNTNLYLRHLLPYDHALFFFLLALGLLLARPAGEQGLRRHGWAGALAGFSYAVYPGYFLGPLVLLGVGLLPAAAPIASPEARRAPGRFGPVAAQVAGLGAVLGLFELLARAADTSYFASSRYIATTVTQGSFAEGFGFIGTYFWQVEGWVGVELLVLAVVGLVVSFGTWKSPVAPPRALPVLLAFGGGAWLLYAGAVQWGHWLVFYGRILHFFGPFVVLGTLAAGQRLTRRYPATLKPLLAAGGLVALGNFAHFWTAYRAVDYPADVAYAHGIHDARQIASLTTTGCDPTVINYRVFGPRLRGQPASNRLRYQLVNFAYLYPLSCYRPPVPTRRPVVAAVPYFMKYAPYQFEGHNPAQRALLQRYAYEFRIVGVD